MSCVQDLIDRRTASQPDERTPLLSRTASAPSDTRTTSDVPSAWSALVKAARVVGSSMSKAATFAVRPFWRAPPMEDEVKQAIISWLEVPRGSDGSHDEVANQLTNLALNDFESRIPGSYNGFDSSVYHRFRNRSGMPSRMLTTHVPSSQEGNVGYKHVLEYLDTLSARGDTTPAPAAEGGSLVSRHAKVKNDDRACSNSRMICGQSGRAFWLPFPDWAEEQGVIDDATAACRRLNLRVQTQGSSAL